MISGRGLDKQVFAHISMCDKWELMRILTYLFLAILSLGVLTGVGVVIFVISYYGQGLPDYAQLKKFESPNSLPLMAEHAKEKRIFMPII